MRTTFVIFFIFLSSFTIAQENKSITTPEKNIDKYLKYFSNDNPGAVITVIKNGDILFNKAYGLSNVQTKEVMTTDKTFNLLNLSKSFTSLAVMKLVEKNKLSLDNTINDIFPDFADYGRTIKIRNLLSHSSGLIQYDINTCSNHPDVFTFLKAQDKTVFEPGTKFQYSNSEYVILAMIIEKVSKMSYNEFLTKTIFKKLSMSNTFFADDKRNHTNCADGHFKENEIYIAGNDVSLIYGEQGIFTNSTDFAKWDKALYSDKLLKCESLSKIFTVEDSNLKNNSYYGYGWVLMKRKDTRYYWHGGSGNGYTNLVLHLPDTKTTVLILTNRNDGYDFLKMSIAIAKEFDKNLKL